MSHLLHEEKRAPITNIQHAASSTRRCQKSLPAHRQETYLAQTHIRKMEATGMAPTKLYWQIGRKSKLSRGEQSSEIKSILKPV
jgi:hypothetical protein